MGVMSACDGSSRQMRAFVPQRGDRDVKGRLAEQPGEIFPVPPSPQCVRLEKTMADPGRETLNDCHESRTVFRLA
jgi:hypothetical protein